VFALTFSLGGSAVAGFFAEHGEKTQRFQSRSVGHGVFEQIFGLVDHHAEQPVLEGTSFFAVVRSVQTLHQLLVELCQGCQVQVCARFRFFLFHFFFFG